MAVQPDGRALTALGADLLHVGLNDQIQIGTEGCGVNASWGESLESSGQLGVSSRFGLIAAHDRSIRLLAVVLRVVFAGALGVANAVEQIVEDLERQPGVPAEGA